jgi:hypothetical protein
MPRMIVFAGAMKLAQRALEALNLALIIDLLALGKFQRFQHFFHLFERMFQFFDDAIHLLDGIGNRRLLVWLMRLRTVAPFHVFGAFWPFSAVTLLALFNLLRMFSMFRVFFSRMLKRFGRRFVRRFRVLGFSLRGRGRIAGRG